MGSQLCLICALMAIGVPIAGGFVLLALPRACAQWICTCCAAVATLCTVLVGYAFVTSGAQQSVFDVMQAGTCSIIGFVFDRTSVLLAVVFVGIGLISSLYAIPYFSPQNREHPDHPRRRFYSYLSIFIGSMAGVAYASTTMAMLLFFEITTACSWGLIGYYHSDRSLRAATKSLVVTYVGVVALIIAMTIAFAQTGTFAFSALAALDSHAKTVVLICVVVASWAKSVQWPLHLWLPDAMEAPTPASAYLHGASLMAVGVTLLARTLLSAGQVPLAIGRIIVVGSIVTMSYALLMYIAQTDLKRLLAYSTMAQLSYAFIGFGIAIFAANTSDSSIIIDVNNNPAFTGAIAHVVNHAFAKTLFFMVAGVLSYEVGSHLITDVRGLLRTYPQVGVGFVLAALSMAGAPPMGCFFSEMQIIVGGVAAGLGRSVLLVFVIVLVAETVLSFAWFMHVMGFAFKGEPTQELASKKPLPPLMSLSIVVLSVMSLVSGFGCALWLQ